MLRRFISWIKSYYQQPEPVIKQIPVVASEDVWDILYELAVCMKGRRFESLGIRHFDIVVSTYCKNIDELFMRMEMVIGCIRKEQSSPPEWKGRSITQMLDPLPEFLYNEIRGYWSVEEVVGHLIDKTLIIHHQLEHQSINPSHSYYFYMRKEFYQVISDAVEVLSRLDETKL